MGADHIKKSPGRSSGALDTRVPATDFPHRFVLLPISLRDFRSNSLPRLFRVDKNLNPFQELVRDFLHSLFAGDLAVAQCNKLVSKRGATDRKSDETFAAIVNHSITFSSLEPRPNTIHPTSLRLSRCAVFTICRQSSLWSNPSIFHRAQFGTLSSYG